MNNERGTFRLTQSGYAFRCWWCAREIPLGTRCCDPNDKLN
jgi:hypothetical protein